MSENHSQHQANKALRVLSDKRLKYTVQVHLPDGSKFEFQCTRQADVRWDDSTRQKWVYSEYGSMVMPWSDGMVILCEENPQP